MLMQWTKSLVANNPRTIFSPRRRGRYRMLQAVVPHMAHLNIGVLEDSPRRHIAAGANRMHGRIATG